MQEALRWLPTDTDSAPSDTTTTASMSTVAPADSSAGRVRVLIADDNADMREYLTHLLVTSGYEVTGVPDGRQALETIRFQLPDLVISDVMMPGVDGLQLLAALRNDPRAAALPVLLLSARAGQEASVEGLLAGADDYLVKPFAAAEFLARVRANVELARLRNHHARWRTALIDSLQEAFSSAMSTVPSSRSIQHSLRSSAMAQNSCRINSPTLGGRTPTQTPKPIGN